MTTFWFLLAVVSFITFFVTYNLNDLWAFEDNFEITKKTVAIHMIILVVSAALWPFAWLFIAASLISGTWNSFVAWYRREIAEKLINRI